VSHYLMGLTSPLADNISNNVIGLGLGTLFRFALYRWWVFSPNRSRVLRSAELAQRLGTVVPYTSVKVVELPTSVALETGPTINDSGLIERP
jgi:hypothetical protein